MSSLTLTGTAGKQVIKGLLDVLIDAISNPDFSLDDERRQSAFANQIQVILELVESLPDPKPEAV